MRKKLFYYEKFEGPFEVKGQEMRRIVGTSAEHQTTSYPGSGCINHDQPLESPVPRNVSGCAVCARSFWLEELYELDLFVRPEDGKKTDGADGSADVAAEPLAADREETDEVPEDFTCQPCGSRRFSVQPKCAATANKLLDVRRYSDRWPKIPKHELFSSSVQHPHKPEWRWLLHTKHVPEMLPGPDGRYPTVPACHDCADALHRDAPKAIRMPRYALANDNWMGRMPFPLAPGGKPLSDMTLKLSLIHI